MERKVVLCIITNNKGELLLQKKTMDYPMGPGKWVLFGGQTESDNINKEIERELKEEIGIKLKPKFIFSKKAIVKGQKFTEYVFFDRLDDLSKIKLNEGAGFAFINRKELNKIDVAEDIKLILMEYFKLKK